MRGLLARLARRLSKPKNKVLVLIDWENLLSSSASIPPERFSFSLEAALDNLIETIARKIGAIIGIYVFTPPHLASSWGEMLKRQGFVIVFCPRAKDKTGKERDSVDEELINFGVRMIKQVPGLTHLCLGSGDQDFIPLLREAKHNGLKVALASGTLQSLSSELIDFADRDLDGGRMIYMFSSV